jgi:hypothetical protein
MVGGIGRSTDFPRSARESSRSFRRFPLVGLKAQDFELFAQSAELLAKKPLSEADYSQVLLLREQMNRGGKRRYTTERILRDYTPSPLAHPGERDEIVRSHGRP